MWPVNPFSFSLSLSLSRARSNSKRAVFRCDLQGTSASSVRDRTLVSTVTVTVSLTCLFPTECFQRVSAETGDDVLGEFRVALAQQHDAPPLLCERARESALSPFNVEKGSSKRLHKRDFFV